MSESEDVSLETGFNTPVPELDDHRQQFLTVHRSRSRRGTVDNMHSAYGNSPDLNSVNRNLQPIIARDFEQAVEDDDREATSPYPSRAAVQERSRRGTATTSDARSTSPPNSVKAFADARRRERGVSTSDPNFVKAFTDARRHEDYDLHRMNSAASRRSKRSMRSRRYTNDIDAKSFAGSCQTAEEDVCFPLHNSGNKDTLEINFELLEDFISEEEIRAREPESRVFPDLRPSKELNSLTTITSSGDVVDVPSGKSFTKISESDSLDDLTETPQRLENRFEFFSSAAESTIHAAEFGGLILPAEDVRSLFSLPQEGEMDGVWWLNMNAPTYDEIRAICKAFGVHPLTIEDICTQETREKIEIFPSYYFACFRSFHVEKVDDGQEYKPFNFYVVVFREGLLSFSFSLNPHASNVRKRITLLKDYLALNADWICYALIDNIVDCFAPVIDRIERETDVIEDQVFIARNDDMHTFLRKIGMARKNVMGLMRLLGGKADVLKGFTKRCNANYKVTPHMEIGLYLGDIQDHLVTMMTSLAHFEKMLSRSHSNYLAQLSIDNITQGNNANKVLSKITLLASILVPLNLVCGMFGMNVTVPWENSGSLVPFFGILGSLIAFVIISLVVARKMKFI